MGRSGGLGDEALCETVDDGLVLGEELVDEAAVGGVEAAARQISMAEYQMGISRACSYG